MVMSSQAPLNATFDVSLKERVGIRRSARLQNKLPSSIIQASTFRSHRKRKHLQENIQAEVEENASETVHFSKRRAPQTDRLTWVAFHDRH